MSECYYSPAGPRDGRITLGGAEARHVSRVMRHQRGDKIVVVDGLGTEFDVVLEAVRPNEVVGRVLAAATGRREPRHSVTLALAVLKGDKLALACEQAAELGISRFIPLKTERTIGRLSAARLERLQGVALAAMKSCTRTVLTVIEPVQDLARLASRAAEYGQALVAYEDEYESGLDNVLDRRASSLLLVVGPEGGFAPDEVRVLNSAGVKSFSLGPRRLRAETAATTVVVSAMQLLGDLGGRNAPEQP
jgi:16S rRNA (uracil1498-N3)-methyltransferase